MIEVFKTNVGTPDESHALISRLQEQFPFCKINFDLDDCDRILRIEGNEFCIETISQILSSENYTCEVLV